MAQHNELQPEQPEQPEQHNAHLPPDSDPLDDVSIEYVKQPSSEIPAAHMTNRVMAEKRGLKRPLAEIDLTKGEENTEGQPYQPEEDSDSDW